jgi:SAM-dependent methyltransferase
MDESDTGQITQGAAMVYEEFFVPALFQPWAIRVVNAADVQPNQHVLDVACGTGIVARTASERAGPNGTVIGLDLNEGMLAVAARRAPNLQWKTGRAESLPFDSNHFDAAICQFGLMFFENPVATIREMLRVTRPGGRLVAAVWAGIEKSPGYAQLANLIEREIGIQAANALRTPFKMGDEQLISSMFQDAGVPSPRVAEYEEAARFPSMEAWLFTEIKGWVLADSLSDAQFAQLLKEAERALASFVTSTGSVEFPVRAYIATSTKVV